MKPVREVHVLLGGVKVAERIGTWLIHRVAEEEVLAHLIGYVRFKIEDFERRCDRTRNRKRLDYYRRRIGHWRRALRWLGSIDPEHSQELGRRVVRAIEQHQEWRKLPLVAPDEVDPAPAKPSQKLRDTRRKRAQRYRSRPVRSRLCDRCNGLGYVVS